MVIFRVSEASTLVERCVGDPDTLSKTTCGQEKLSCLQSLASVSVRTFVGKRSALVRGVPHNAASGRISCPGELTKEMRRDELENYDLKCGRQEARGDSI